MRALHSGKCPTVEQLANCLDPVSESMITTVATLTIHLEKCVSCRQTLTFLAGEPQWWNEAESFLTRSESEGETRVSQRVCALTGYQDSKQLDQLSEQELLQLKQMLSPPSHPELLGRISRYELEQLVGRGGMGWVFRAYDTELNRTVAVKILAMHLIAIGTARERFVREARAVASLSHPHIVPMYDIVTDGEVPALVMQFIAGETLQRRISQRGPMPLEDVLQIGIQLADALALAHSHGLVHRDIKPGNVLLEADGSRAMLSDFGLVRALDDAALTHSGLLAGTPDYMSPEQARGQTVDARSDLFSLGSVLYTMLVGHPPFRAPEPMAVLNRICHERHRPACVADTRVPIEVSQLIDRLLAKDAKRRIASAELVRDRLLELSRSPRRLTSEGRIMKRSARLVVIAALILVAALMIRKSAPALFNRSDSERSTAVYSTEITGSGAIDPADELFGGALHESGNEPASGFVSLNSFSELKGIDELLRELADAISTSQFDAPRSTETAIEPFQSVDGELETIGNDLRRFEKELGLQSR